MQSQFILLLDYIFLFKLVVLQLVIHEVAFSKTRIFFPFKKKKKKLDSHAVQHGINITLCVCD